MGGAHGRGYHAEAAIAHVRQVATIETQWRLEDPSEPERSVTTLFNYINFLTTDFYAVWFSLHAGGIFSV